MTTLSITEQLRKLRGYPRRHDPRFELHESVGEYLEIIKDVLERARDTKDEKIREVLFDVAQEMLSNYERLSKAERVVLGIPPDGNIR